MALINMQERLNQAKANTLANAIPVNVTSITGNLVSNEDLSQVALYENTLITLTGTVDTDDRVFAFPLVRNDGKICLFYADVVNNVITAEINIPEYGSYVITTSSINNNPDSPVYKIDPISFEVLRDTGVSADLSQFNFNGLN